MSNEDITCRTRGNKNIMVKLKFISENVLKEKKGGD